MSFPTYPQYQDSGRQWLGQIPQSWRLVPFWSLFRRVKRTDFPEEELLSVYRDYGVIRKRDRDDNFNKASEDLGPYQLVEPGDLAVNKMKAWQGSLGVSPYRGIVSPAYFVYRALHEELPQYLHFLLRSDPYATGFLTISKGIRTNQWDVDPDHLAQLPIPLPSRPEQASIAAFLDRETAKIDALVEEQRRLIELLKEKRQAVISRAVTKGLDSTVTMKDSGVEWLGHVPAHWPVIPLGYLARIGNGSTPNRENMAYWEGGHFPWLNSAVVNEREVFSADQFVTDRALADCHLPIVRPPAVLVGITGQGRTRGMATSLKIEATVNQHVAYIKPDKDKLRHQFLLRFLEGAYSHLRAESDIGSTKGAITCELLSTIKIPLPPVEEQRAISDYLNVTVGDLELLVAEAERASNLLQEHRAALITAAVTGKIDLRSAALRQAEAA